MGLHVINIKIRTEVLTVVKSRATRNEGVRGK